MIRRQRRGFLLRAVFRGMRQRSTAYRRNIRHSRNIQKTTPKQINSEFGIIVSASRTDSNLREPLKTGAKSKNGQGVPDSRKADEVRLYALRGGLTTKMARTAHFRSHKVFRGDLDTIGIQPRQRLRNSEFRIHNSEFILSCFRSVRPCRGTVLLHRCHLRRMRVSCLR